MKKIGMKILKYILCFIILMLMGVLLLILSNKIPSNMLEKNIKESADVLKKEGELKKIHLFYKDEFIFSFIDALMLNMAYSVDSSSPIDSMILSRKDYIPGINKEQNIEITENIGADERFIDPINGDVFHTSELYQLINGKDMQVSYEYARYWHGYMIILRPLLTIFNIVKIRNISTILLIFMGISCFYLIYKRIDLLTSIAFVVGFLGCSFFMVGQSLSEIPVFIVTFVLSIILLLKEDINNNIGLLFFCAGSIVGFADLLTEPIISLFIPITLYFLLNQKEELSLKDIVKRYLFLCIIWGIGYALTWMSKWIIVDIIKNRGMFKQSLQQIIIRSKGTNPILYRDILSKINYLSSNLCLYIFICVPSIIVSIIYAIIKKMPINIKILPYIVNSIIPFVWYFLIKNHSWLHPFFAYKLLAISIINILVIYIYIFKLYKNEEKKEEKT